MSEDDEEQGGLGTSPELRHQGGGGSINIPGGDLYVGEGGRRSATIGRVVAALGLALFFAGLGCLLYMTVRGIWGDEFDLMPWIPLGGGLVLSGVALNRFGRLIAGRW